VRRLERPKICWLRRAPVDRHRAVAAGQLAFDVFEHQEALAARLFEPVDRGDVDESATPQLRLALEARQTLGIAGERLGSP
jgi:hypothetical protein